MTLSPPLLMRVGVVVLLCSVVCPAAALAQDEAFRRGLDARGDRNWKATATQMRAAIESDAKESTRKVGSGLLRAFGQGMEYLPHYFLGEALFNLQDCVGAVEQWAISEQQAAVQERKEFVAFIQSGYKTCAARGVLPPNEYSTQLAATTQAVGDATALAKSVSDRGQKVIELWSSPMNEQYMRSSTELVTAQTRLTAGTQNRSASDFGEARAAAARATAGLRAVEGALGTAIANRAIVQGRLREVEALIQEAENTSRETDNVKVPLTEALATSRQSGRDLLERARERTRTAEKTYDVAAVSEGAKLAQEATALFREVLEGAGKLAVEALDREFAAAGTAAAEALSFLDASLATLARRLLAKVPAASPDTTAKLDAFRKTASAIRRRFDTAQKARNVSGLKETTRLADETRTAVDVAVNEFGPQTLVERGLHESLVNGARLFFAGDYEQALTALDTSALDGALLQGHAHLLRAAALYHLFVRSGEKDQSLRERALAEIAVCKQVNAALTPDARAFSPRFLQFFQDAATPAQH